MPLPIPLTRPALAWFCGDVPGLAGFSPGIGQWGLVCVAVLVTLYFVMRSGRRRPGADSPPGRPPGSPSLSQERQVERQMQNLLVELSDMARQITAQLDTRTTKLALMIDDADEKAARLQRQIDAVDERTSALQRLLDESRVAPPPPPAAGPPEPPIFQPSLALPNAADARHQEIYGLLDRGLSAAEIARQLGRPQGEIGLIIALRLS